MRFNLKVFYVWNNENFNLNKKNINNNTNLKRSLRIKTHTHTHIHINPFIEAKPVFLFYSWFMIIVEDDCSDLLLLLWLWLFMSAWQASINVTRVNCAKWEIESGNVWKKKKVKPYQILSQKSPPSVLTKIKFFSCFKYIYSVHINIFFYILNHNNNNNNNNKSQELLIYFSIKTRNYASIYICVLHHLLFIHFFFQWKKIVNLFSKNNFFFDAKKYYNLLLRQEINTNHPIREVEIHYKLLVLV